MKTKQNGVKSYICYGKSNNTAIKYVVGLNTKIEMNV